jgi:hypothetical protein
VFCQIWLKFCKIWRDFDYIKIVKFREIEIREIELLVFWTGHFYHGRYVFDMYFWQCPCPHSRPRPCPWPWPCSCPCRVRARSVSVFMSMLHVHFDAACPCSSCISWPCRCCMSTSVLHVHVITAFSCHYCIFMSPSCMSKLCLRCVKLCCMPMLHYLCCLSMLHVYAACMSKSPCCISMKHVRCMSMMLVYVACQCCMLLFCSLTRLFCNHRNFANFLQTKFSEISWNWG